MATSSPSPTSPLTISPTSSVISSPQPSIPSPVSPSETNANPPEPSNASPPSPVTSPPPSTVIPSPPPTSSPPPPVATSTPPAPATSPPPPPTVIPSPPPSVNAPPPSPPPPPPSVLMTPVVSPPPTTTATPPLTSPPPPSTYTPPVLSPPPDPPSSPPPPTSIPKSPHSSPPPPASNPQPPVSLPAPPPAPHSTPPPPPPSTNSTHITPSASESPKNSPSLKHPSASPSKNSSSSSSSQTPPTSSRLSPPPVSPSPSSSIPTSVNPLSASSTGSSPSKGVPVGGVVAIGVVVGVVILGLIGLVVLFMSKRRRTSKHNGGYIVPSPYGSSPGSDLNLIVKTEASTPFARSGSGSGNLSPHSHGGLGQSRSWFTYQELYEATNGYALENLLGEGGFGLVYKGVLANGREVAVKHLKVGGSQGEREFQAEVETISRIHHRHLVSLVGYCMYESKRLLVYEYVPNQTLYYHLHGENRRVLDWATRIKIAEGAARGITYLHEDCHPRIIHRDIKSSNILLDNKFEARVSDFGLAKLALDAESHVSTRVMGTFGYMAPEYATSGKLTDKSDVFSFGVVLLELITGRKPVDGSQPIGDESLVEWARPLLNDALHTGQVEGLVDPRLEKNYVESELFLMIEAAAACVRHLATKRPRMGQVVRAFDGRSPSDLSNGMRVGQSEIYDSAQQSADIRWFRRMAFGSHGYSTDYFSEAIRNNESVNPNQNDQGAVFLTQQGKKDSLQQQSQNIYFSSHRTQSPAFSGQWSQNPDLFRQSSQNPISRQQSG